VDLGQIDAWWTANASYNIGFLPGGAGLIVIDIDVKGGAVGMQTARELGLLDVATLKARTPSGGLHLFFAKPAALGHVGNSHALGAGIDVRADGGYVLLAPSVLTGGRTYVWN